MFNFRKTDDGIDDYIRDLEKRKATNKNRRFYERYDDLDQTSSKDEDDENYEDDEDYDSTYSDYDHQDSDYDSQENLDSYYDENLTDDNFNHDEDKAQEVEYEAPHLESPVDYDPITYASTTARRIPRTKVTSRIAKTILAIVIVSMIRVTVRHLDISSLFSDVPEEAEFIYEHIYDFYSFSNSADNISDTINAIASDLRNKNYGNDRTKLYITQNGQILSFDKALEKYISSEEYKNNVSDMKAYYENSKSAAEEMEVEESDSKIEEIEGWFNKTSKSAREYMKLCLNPPANPDEFSSKLSEVREAYEENLKYTDTLLTDEYYSEED